MAVSGLEGVAAAIVPPAFSIDVAPIGFTAGEEASIFLLAASGHVFFFFSFS